MKHKTNNIIKFDKNVIRTGPIIWWIVSVVRDVISVTKREYNIRLIQQFYTQNTA